jgi:hypothetical protein
MIVSNIYSGIDSRGLNKIVQEISYLKDKEIIELKRRYNIFTILLSNRKKVKNIKEKMSYKQIGEIANISKELPIID